MEETTNLLKPILNTIQITSAVILIGIILMQVRGQGGGLFGASDGSFRTRRGIERTLFQATIILSIFFIIISIVSARYL